MVTHDKQAQVLAVVLAALAGYIDAFGFIATGGFFVSFMSGNSTRMGIRIAQDSAMGLTAAMLIGVLSSRGDHWCADGPEGSGQATSQSCC